jgi:hypothetical protein
MEKWWKERTILLKEYRLELEFKEEEIRQFGRDEDNLKRKQYILIY